jgi:predicted nucleic acid-binding protein
LRALVDTSVWSLVLRRRGPADHPQAAKLQRLLDGEEEVAITGAILQEILQAFRLAETVAKVIEYLEPLPLLELDRETCIDAAGIHRACASKGIAASTLDCQIAAAALRHDYPLLSADTDFERIARVCDLELL